MIGSLNFAVIFESSVLGLTLIVSTSLESYYGTPFAQSFSISPAGSMSFCIPCR